MSDLVGNPEDRFSCVAAHISSTMKYLLSFAFANTCKTQLGYLSMNKELFSCSAQLSWKFKVLIHTEIAKINQHFRFRSPNPVIYPANKC